MILVTLNYVVNSWPISRQHKITLFSTMTRTKQKQPTRNTTDTNTKEVTRNSERIKQRNKRAAPDEATGRTSGMTQRFGGRKKSVARRKEKAEEPAADVQGTKGTVAEKGGSGKSVSDEDHSEGEDGSVVSRNNSVKGNSPTPPRVPTPALPNSVPNTEEVAAETLVNRFGSSNGNNEVPFTTPLDPQTERMFYEAATMGGNNQFMGVANQYGTNTTSKFCVFTIKLE